MTMTTMNFKQHNVGQGVRLHLCETDKFKSLTCKLFIQQELKTKEVASTALLPFLLRRGSQTLPSTLQVARELEYLYAAEFASDILKIGERQILEFHFQMVDPALLPGGENQVKRGLRTFWEIVSQPAGPGDRFVDSYFAQEKNTLGQELEGLVNEKRSYALARSMALMCSEEPFGIYKYGDLETLRSLDNRQVFKHYQSLLTSFPLDIFLVGSNLDEAAQLISTLVGERKDAVTLKQPKEIQVGEPRSFEDTMDLQQAVLILTYRTNTSYLDEDYYALLVGNGILGGFAHSKLFMNVREKASLAYYAGSSIEGSKGLLTISAGISGEKQEQAVEIMQEQVGDIQRGQITPEELAQTKQGLISAMTSMNDNPSSVIDRNIIGIVQGEMRTLERVVDAIQKVEIDDVIKVMSKIKLDTTYILRAPRQKGADHGAN